MPQPLSLSDKLPYQVLVGRGLLVRWIVLRKAAVAGIKPDLRHARRSLQRFSSIHAAVSVVA